MPYRSFAPKMSQKGLKWPKEPCCHLKTIVVKNKPGFPVDNKMTSNGKVAIKSIKQFVLEQNTKLWQIESYTKD